MLVAVVVLAAYVSGTGFVGAILLLVGVVVVPGAIHKRGKTLFRAWGIKDSRRPVVAALLVLLAAVLCYWWRVPQPVPATVTAMVLGSLGLAISRKLLNVSAHVSVISFAVLWAAVIFGGWAWALLVLSPVMILARVLVREHKWSESFAGALLGLATYGCFMAALIWS
ncbi:hypothetical protein ANMWB30_24280 [Arthrobacter sp. MWB30]|nr:hypothetical protein ANMWB30_24280 [Arthrobacter sp. MWB30]